MKIVVDLYPGWGSSISPYRLTRVDEDGSETVYRPMTRKELSATVESLVDRLTL